jgi:UDP-3-O-[3-hydroxymyristoyl] glucosamine N-acyltransferase
MGYPAIPLRDFQRSAIVFKNLPEMQRIVYDLKRQLEVLKKC